MAMAMAAGGWGGGGGGGGCGGGVCVVAVPYSRLARPTTRGADISVVSDSCAAKRNSFVNSGSYSAQTRSCSHESFPSHNN